MSNIFKGIGKILLIIIVVLYLVLEIFLAVCLLNYNDYRITVFGNKSLLLLTEDLDEKYKKNDLVIVTKGDGSEVKEGDSIILYIPNIVDTYPDVTVNGEDWTVSDVEKFCDEYGLTISISYEETNKYKEGQIIAQNRAKGTNIIKGSTFKITVAKKVKEVEPPKEEEKPSTEPETETP